MKHSFRITIIITLIFFFSQIVGLLITNEYIDHTRTTEEARQLGNITWQTLPYDIERPKVQENTSYIFIIGAVFIGTVFLLLLVKFKIFKLWKFWFFLSVWACLTISLAAFIPQSIAMVISLILAYIKINKPNPITHNLTELFIYGGLAAIFVPIMNIFSVSMLLLIISIYDIWAVWHSKHMIKLANFQTDSKIFAGLYLPYSRKENIVNKKPKNVKVQKIQNAILGGGDVGFPLIFAGVIMKKSGLLNVLPIPILAAIALFLLLLLSKKDKFYPAMPFLSIACFIGYALVLVISSI